MLGAGLRREFPGAFGWLDRVTGRVPLLVRRSAPPWAALAGLGVQGLLAVLLGFAFFLVLAAIDGRADRSVADLRPAALGVLGALAAAIVAGRAGGKAGLVLLAAALIALQASARFGAAQGLDVFCERSGPEQPLCADRGLLGEFAAWWPLLAGLAIGAFLMRGSEAPVHGRNPLLEALGVVVAGLAVGQVLVLPFRPTAGDPADAAFWTAMVFLQIAAAVAGGAVLARRGGSVLPVGAVAASVFYLVPVLPLLPDNLRFPSPGWPIEYALVTFAPAINAIAFVAAAVIAAGGKAVAAVPASGPRSRVS